LCRELNRVSFENSVFINSTSFPSFPRTRAEPVKDDDDYGYDDIIEGPAQVLRDSGAGVLNEGDMTATDCRFDSTTARPTSVEVPFGLVALQ